MLKHVKEYFKAVAEEYRMIGEMEGYILRF